MLRIFKPLETSLISTSGVQSSNRFAAVEIYTDTRRTLNRAYVYVQLGGLIIMARCTYCGSNRLIEQNHAQAKVRGGVSTVPACRTCNRSKSKKTLKNFLIYIFENDKYRWNRIVAHNKGKRSEIAKQVRTIRDSKTAKKHDWVNDYAKPSTNKGSKTAKWRLARKSKSATFVYKGTRYRTGDYFLDKKSSRLRRK